jgi:Bifunctional DNA primase/polymerase, N-terminal
VRTPSGGTHLYFRAAEGRAIRNSAGKVGPMVDVRASGGYVVGAGSVTTAGVYEAVIEADPLLFPGWLADLADPPRADRARPVPVVLPVGRVCGGGYAEAALRRELEEVLTAPGGQRNTRLHRAAFSLGQLVTAGQLEESRVVVLLHQAGEALGLVAEDGPRAVDATIASGLRAGAEHPRRAS